MRSILDFVRRALASVARFAFVFVKGVGDEVGRWVRVLQPGQPSTPTEDPRTVDQMLPHQRAIEPSAEASYEAIRQVAAALAVGADPKPAELAAINDADVKEWIGMLRDSELRLVAQLSTQTLRAHLTGRFRAPGLLRLSNAEMIDRRRELGQRPHDELDDSLDHGLVLAS